MKVHVTFFAQLAAALGSSEGEVELADGAGMAELYSALADRGGEGVRALLLDASGAPRPSVLAFVGDRQARPGDALADGAEVFLATPISGG